MRTEMEEQFYTTLFQFIITWYNNTNKYNWRSLAHLCWKEHIPSFKIFSSVSQIRFARWIIMVRATFVLITRKEGGA